MKEINEIKEIKENKEIEKYLLVQESCINKLIMIFDLLCVYFAVIIICLFIICKYKTFSTLYFLSIYGVAFSILSIIYYFRFKYIKIENKKEKDTKIKEINIINKHTIIQNQIRNIKNNKIIYNIGEQKIKSKPQKNVESSIGKILNTNKSIKEAPSEEEQTHEEKNINIKKFNNNINNKINMINLDKNLKAIDIENDEDIIYNPYREDFILESDNKNEKNAKMSELKHKEIKNKNLKNNSEEYNVLRTYRSFGSEDMKIGSLDSDNPINNIRGFNSKLFDTNNNEHNEEKFDNDDEDDNSSVIHNPLRDDIIF